MKSETQSEQISTEELSVMIIVERKDAGQHNIIQIYTCLSKRLKIQSEIAAKSDENWWQAVEIFHNIRISIDWVDS